MPIEKSFTKIIQQKISKTNKYLIQYLEHHYKLPVPY